MAAIYPDPYEWFEEDIRSSPSMTERLFGRLAEYLLPARSVVVLRLDNPGEHSSR
jgi:hypothetical protein